MRTLSNREQAILILAKKDSKESIYELIEDTFDGIALDDEDEELAQDEIERLQEVLEYAYPDVAENVELFYKLLVENDGDLNEAFAKYCWRSGIKQA